MRFSCALLVAVIATTAAACSPEAATVPGVAGAGVQVEIVGVTRDSIGYTIKLQITNRDTAVVVVDPFSLGWVETMDNSGGWTSLARPNDELLYAAGVYPGTKPTFLISKQVLNPGTEVRMTLDWDYLSGSKDNLTMSEPAAVK